MKKERNLKRITLGEEMLEYVLGNPKNYIVKNEFPDGAVIKDMYRKPASQTFEVVFQHDSWEEVEEGEE